MAKKRFFLSLKIQLLIFCLLTFFPIILVSSYFFHEHTKEVLIRELKHKLWTIAELSAEQISYKNIEELINSKDINSKSYKTLKKQLISIKGKFPNLKSISIIVNKENNKAFYLVSEGNNNFSLEDDNKIILDNPSSEIVISNEVGLNEGFNNTIVSDVNYSDKKSHWIRAYSPIPQENKISNSVLVVELYLTKLQLENDNFYELFQKVLIIGFLIIIFLLLISVKVLLYPIKKLRKKVNNISIGEFSEKIPFSGLYGEIGELIDSVNDMSVNIEKKNMSLAENTEKLEEKQKLIEITNKEIKSKNLQLNNTIITLNAINNIIEKSIFIRQTDELMDTVLPETVNILKAEKGIILEYFPENDTFSIMSSHNTNIIKKNMLYELYENEYLKKISDTKNIINIHEKGSFYEEEFENCLLFPLLLEKELQGVMVIMNKQKNGQFKEEEEASGKTLSKLIAAIWESIHLFELATIDSLSKLYVRRYLEKILDEGIKKAYIKHSHISLLMIDIDNLEKCNSEFGHKTGDQVIKEIAEKLKEMSGDFDVAARYGGEKMILFMPDKNSEEAYEYAEEIRQNIEELEMTSNNGDKFKVTVSIGVSSFPEHGFTSEEIIKSADKALYKSKTEGRNQVNIFEKKTT